jgi:hypothetical protein
MNELQRIPGVGKKTEEDFELIGIHKISDLKNKDPEELYYQLCVVKEEQIDRCVLYVFRCAVYYATEKIHDPEKLKWWNWKEI